MKNKRLLRVLATISLSTVAMGCTALFGCSGCSHTHTYSDTLTNTDPAGHYYAATCEHTGEKKDFEAHVYDNDNDADCNVCGYVREITPSAQYTVTYHMNGHGAQIDAATVPENGKLTKPTDPAADGVWTFVGWYTDEKCETAYDFDAPVTGNLDLYAKWTHDHDYDKTKWAYDAVSHYHACKIDGCTERADEAKHNLNEQNVCTECGAIFKQAVYEFIPSDLEAKAYAEGYTSGLFSILAGTTVRTRARENYSVYDYKYGYYKSEENVAAGREPVETGFTASKSVKCGAKTDGISVNAIAPGKFTVYVDNGSSGKTENDLQHLTLTKPDGSTEDIAYCCIGLYAITIDCTEAGVYTLTRSTGTNDIYYAKFETNAPVTAVEKIQVVDGGKVKYIIGEELDTSKLQVQIVREITGMIEPVDVSDLEITTDFDNTKAGKYTVTVTYTDENQKKFTDSYEVVVFDVEALELGFNAIVQGGNTSYGNGQYINHTVKQFYFKGETLDLDGLTVKTVLDGGKQKFIVEEGFTVTGFDSSKAGKQIIKVTWDENPDAYAEFVVYVADYTVADVQTASEIVINVSAGLDETAVGAKDNGAYQFRTIQQALDFLNAVNLDQNVKKTINLAAGEYKEKLEITVPNLTIIGADKDATKTVIEWDSLFGLEDEGGFVHTTDSTATLNVRESAVGFVIENVTISNWYNSTEHFDEALGANCPEHRALAMLIQADMVVVDNCRLLGYQDTLELFTGRQFFNNSYINGRTDFIFGTNNTTYFYNCEIESIVSGGYVTAFKGCNKGEADAITYGAIFDKCKFTAPDEVVAKKDTSLGRTWGAYAAVAYIDCDMAGHISKVPYGAAGEKNFRYTAMSGNTPVDETVKFVEYNNSGAGALVYTAEDEANNPENVAGTQYAVAGMKLLDAAAAANYKDKAVFFGEPNGYAKAWDGSKGVVITEKSYKFDAEAFPDGDVSVKPEEVTPEGMDIFGGDMTVHGAWHTELGANKNFGWFVADTVIEFNVEGKVEIKTYGTPYGAPENVKINYINGKARVTIVATEGEKITNGCCITLIKVDKTERPAHVHEYGEWTVEPASEGENYGVAKRHCLHCELATPDEQVVTLPALSDVDYTITAGTTAGNATYTYASDYGDITFEAAELAGKHTHQYGDWTSTATLEAAGTATRSCQVDGCEEAGNVQTVNVPALTDEAYTVTNNTATVGQKGTGTYTIVVGEQTITFEAETAALELKRPTENYKYEYGGSGDPVSDEHILFTNCGNNGGWVKLVAGSSVTLNLPEGAVLTFTRSPYDHGSVFVNEEKQAAEAGGTVTYNIAIPGFVTITTDNQLHFKIINVEVDPNYQHKHTYGNWTITAPTTEAVGSATRECLVPDCGVDNPTQTVELPVLSVDNYTVAPSDTAGKSIYTLKTETSISFEADSLAGLHVHNYSDWTVTAENLPTQTEGGKATRTCSGEGVCADALLELALPRLDDSRYVITNNTATLQSDGTGTYTIELDGETISFTAATPMLVLETITKAKTFTALTDGNTTTSLIYFNNTNVHNSKYWMLGTGSQIAFKVGANAKITFKSDAWGGGIAVTGGDGTLKQEGSDYVYTATNADTITVALPSGASNAGYILSIAISYDLQVIESNYTYTWSNPKSDGANYDIPKSTPVDSPDLYLEFKGCKANDDWLAYGGNGSSIKLIVKSGATITVQASPYDGSSIVKINDTEVTRNENNVITYTATVDGEVIITSSGSAYIKSINVSYTA